MSHPRQAHEDEAKPSSTLSIDLENCPWTLKELRSRLRQVELQLPDKKELNKAVLAEHLLCLHFALREPQLQDKLLLYRKRRGQIFLRMQDFDLAFEEFSKCPLNDRKLFSLESAPVELLFMLFRTGGSDKKLGDMIDAGIKPNLSLPPEYHKVLRELSHKMFDKTYHGSAIHCLIMLHTLLPRQDRQIIIDDLDQFCFQASEIAFQEKRYDDALSYCRTAKSITALEIQKKLNKFEVQITKIKQAIKKHNKAAAHDKSQPQVQDPSYLINLYIQGEDLLLRAGKPQEALGRFKEVEKIKAKEIYQRLDYYLGCCYYALEKHVQAIAHYSKTIIHLSKLFPALDEDELFNLYVKCAESYSKISSFANAIELAEKGLAQLPKNRILERNLALYLKKRGLQLMERNPQEAYSHFVKSLQLAEQQGNASEIKELLHTCGLQLAQIAFNKGDYDQSLAHLDQAENNKPNEARALELRGDIHHARKDQASALRCYSSALQQNSKQTTGALSAKIAQLHLEEKDEEQSIHFLEQACQNETNDSGKQEDYKIQLAHAHYKQAIHKEESSQIIAAIESINKALALAPESPQYKEKKKELYRRQTQISYETADTEAKRKAALDFFEETGSLFPDLAETQGYAALLTAQQGDFKQASYHLNEMLHPKLRLVSHPIREILGKSIFNALCLSKNILSPMETQCFMAPHSLSPDQLESCLKPFYINAALELLKQNKLKLALALLNEAQSRFPQEKIFEDLIHFSHDHPLFYCADRAEENTAYLHFLTSLKDNHPFIPFHLGKFFLQHERLEHALSYLDRFHQNNPGFKHVHYYRGLALLKMKRYEESIRALEESNQFVLERSSPAISRETRHALSQAYYEHAQTHSSIELKIQALRSSLRHNPNHEKAQKLLNSAYYELGYQNYSQGNDEEALKCFEYLAKQENLEMSKRIYLFYSCAHLYAKKNDYKNAMRYFEYCLQHDRVFLSNATGIQIGLLNLIKRYPSFITESRLAAMLDSPPFSENNHAEFYYTIAQMLSKKNLRKAIFVLFEALKYCPHHVEQTKYLLAEYYCQLSDHKRGSGQLEAAHKNLQKSIVYNFKNPVTFFKMAALFGQAGNEVEMGRFQKTASYMHTEDPVLLLMQGNACSARRDYNQSIDRFEKALQRVEHPNTRNKLIQAYLDRAAHSENEGTEAALNTAIEDLKKAQEYGADPAMTFTKIMALCERIRACYPHSPPLTTALRI